MRLSRLFILLVAAFAGTAVYRLRQALEDDGNSLTGEGSLYRTVQSARRGDSGYAGGIGGIGKRAGRNDDIGLSPVQPNDLPLIEAAAKGDKAKVEQRLAAHIKIDSRDNQRRTPLMYASWNGHNDIIARLLAAGANPEFEDRGGNNAFDYAAGRGLVETVRFLLAHSHSEDDSHYIDYARLIQAVYTGDPNQLPQGEEMPMNRLSPEGQSPLDIAAGNGSVALAQVLIARGADVNLANDEGQTALHWAAWNNHPDMIELLLAKGANIDARDAAGNTALILAASNNGRAAADLLIRHGADKYRANKAGKTAGIIAEDKGYKELADLLK